MSTKKPTFINEEEIARILGQNQKPDSHRVAQVFAKAKEMKGLDLEDVAVLTNINDPMQLFELFETANHVKEKIYGKRLVIFRPRSIFPTCVPTSVPTVRSGQKNKALVRRALSQDEIKHETEILIRQGHQAYFAGCRRIIPKARFSVYN